MTRAAAGLWLVGLWCVGAAGCDEAATEVLLRVRAEQSLPIAQVTVRAVFADGSEDETTLAGDALPFTLPIGPQGNGDSLEVWVRAETQAGEILQHQARTRFRAGRTALLDVELGASCVDGGECGRAQTCSRCGCEALERESLPLVDGNEVEPAEPLRACEAANGSDGGDAGLDAEAGTGGTSGDGGPDTDGGDGDALDAGDGGGEPDAEAGPPAEDCKTRACIRALSLGDGHACFVSDAGELHCWGEGGDGQLGRGELSTGRYPIERVGTASDWQRVSVSPRQSCATRSEGDAYCWGDVLADLDILRPDRSGAALADTDLEAGDGWACGLRTAGTAECWGAYPGVPLLGVLYLEPPAGGGEWVELIDSTTHVYLVDDADNLWSLINESYTLERTGVKQAVLNGARCYLQDDDTLRCGGENARGQAGLGHTVSPATEGEVAVSGVTFTQVAGSSLGTCALDDRGGVWCWGDNRHGMMGVSMTEQAVVSAPRRLRAAPADDPYVQVEVGGTTVCARRQGGFVDCWGGVDPVVFGAEGGALRLPGQ